MTLSPAARTTGLAVVGLGVTQIVGWGTSFMMPSVLGRHIELDLGLPSEIVYGGITVMFGMGALAAPRVGRLIDRRGARTIMALGSLIYAVGLAALALSQNTATYLLGWAVMGVASTLALNTPASVAIAQLAGPGARRAIALLSIIGGFASSVFWPLGGALDVAIGWRGTLLIYAGLHLLLCAPVHLLVLPRKPPEHARSAGGAAAPTGVPEERRSAAFFLLSVMLASGAFVFTGAIVHMIDIMRGLGHAPATAVFLASMIGPSQVGVRIFELLFGHRYSLMGSAVFGSAMLPLGVAAALVAGGSWPVALFCIFTYGIANGLKAVQRATLPLALFGRAQLGTHMGRLALPQGILSASAPPILAAAMGVWGATGALWLIFTAGAISLIAMILLARLARSVR